MIKEHQGKILRVDLSTGKTGRFTINENLLRKFLGGVGMGAHFLYDEVPIGVNWSDPNNRLIFTAGPLNATPIGGSGTISVVSKGPLTNGAGCSQANGYFGAYLRLCGLDGIIIQGASDELKYLYIDSESAELKEAEWLSQMDTYKTADLVKHENGFNTRNMSVASIGPAGENLVKFAGIFFDHGHSASHNGLGAVMGSKKLKAIAVARGLASIPIYNPDGIKSIAKKLIENVKKEDLETYKYGTLNALHSNGALNMLPVKNYTTSKWLIDDEKWNKFTGKYIRENFSIGSNPCWSCQIHHCDIMKITEGPFAGEVMEEPEYEQLVAWSSLIDNEDIMSAMMLCKEVDRLGLETNECGWVVGFIMECYEKGIIKKESLNDIELTWGNANNVILLLNLIAKREGIGDILGEGVMRAAKIIGGEAPSLAIHTLKGNTPRGHDHRNRVTEQFDTIVSNTGTVETWAGPSLLGSFPDWKDVVDANIHDKGAMMFEDSMVTCRFNTRMNVELLSQALSQVTGWDYTREEGYQMGRRIVHLLRAFNTRHGLIGRELDRPSSRYGSKPDSGGGKGKSLEGSWDKMLSRYYNEMGWDSVGRPLASTLMSYGLENVAKDF